MSLESNMAAHYPGETEVLCNGTKINAWSFNPNNVLSWEDESGKTAWLLFMPLAEGPILIGNVLPSTDGTAPTCGSSLSTMFLSSPLSAFMTDAADKA